MRSILVPVIILLAVGGGIAGWYYSDYQVAKRQIIESLERISDTANAMAQNALLSQIGYHFTPDAKVKLNIDFNVFAQGSKKGWQMNHHKKSFADFIKQMTDKCKTYGMTLKMQELVVEEDGTSVEVKIRGAGFATTDAAMALIGRKVPTRFVIKPDCIVTGTVGEMFKIKTMDCPTRMTQQADLKGKHLKGAMQELKGIKP